MGNVNINKGKEEIVSRETAGKIPWRLLTVLLAAIIALGVLWLAATSFAAQTPAKTSSDLTKNLDKSGGGDKSPVVNGTETPSPTADKGQEIETFFGKKGTVITTIPDIPLEIYQEYVKKGLFDVEILITSNGGVEDKIKTVSLPEGQSVVLRLKLYNQEGRLMTFLTGGRAIDYFAETTLPKTVYPSAIGYTTSPVVYYGEVKEFATKAEIVVYSVKEEVSTPTPPRYV